MKIKHLLLGVAVIALMASCGKKAETESVTEETAVETVVEEVVETVTEEVAPVVEEKTAPATQKTTTTAKPAAKATTPAVDPCEAKVKAFEKWVDQLKAAKENKGNGAEALKQFAQLKAQAAKMEQTVAECQNNADYKTRIANAMVAEKTIRQ